MSSSLQILKCKDIKIEKGSFPNDALSFCSDSRQFKDGLFFVAFPGLRHNPLNYAKDLVEKGCKLIVYEKSLENDQIVKDQLASFENICAVSVPDAVAFTQELSMLHAKKWQSSGGYIFAISGSNGKTTHKEMLAQILRASFPNQIESTQKNNNNHLGVPFTLLQIKNDTKVCILELGSNHPGEIEVLCKISNPDGGLVTNIGATHLEFFDNLQNVFLEESYLEKYLHQIHGGKALFFKNLDDPYLSTLLKSQNTLEFSAKNKNADIHFEIGKSEVMIKYKNKITRITNQFITGNHNFLNLATAWCIACELFPDKAQEFVKAAAEFKPTANRSEWKKLGEKNIYLDAYNANPSSMMVAVEGFMNKIDELAIPHQNVLLILGDMNELGTNASTFHKDLGLYLKKWPNAQNAFIGRFAQSYIDGRGEGHLFVSASSVCKSQWDALTNNVSYIFIKGSRSLQLESLLAIT